MKKLLSSPTFSLAIVLLLALAVLQAVLPSRSRSEMENRTLTRFSAPSPSGILSGQWMQATETAVADQFYARDAWMSLQALWDTALLRNERGGILIGHNGWLFEKSDHLNLRTATNSVLALDALAAQCESPVSLMIVPMSSAVYSDQLPSFYEGDDLGKVINNLYSVASQTENCNILNIFEINPEGRPLYYQTDHHWTMEGARAGYEMLVQLWDLPAAGVPVQITEADGFFGTYFSRAPSPLTAGDTLVFETPQGVTLTIEGEEKAGLYDPEQMQARDKYASLLWGNHGRSTLHGPGEGTLLVIKDSYANAMLPLLAQHFERIEMVDLRYFSGSLPALVEETEAGKILCVYGLTTLLTDRSLLLHSADWDV